MTIEVDGKTLETTPTGFLVHQEDWSENVARTLRSVGCSARA